MVIKQYKDAESSREGESVSRKDVDKYAFMFLLLFTIFQVRNLSQKAFFQEALVNKIIR
ncbi:hypothetical protein Hdeb2414_s0008g00286011 [Helianthus debilis subsp. tardiflorus]